MHVTVSFLYDHDKGLVRVRRDFKKKAEKQLAALAAIETTRTNNRTQAIAGD